MAKSNVDGRFAFTKEVRMPFGNLLEARAVGKRGKAKGTPKFSATLLLTPDHPDYEAMRKQAVAVARAQWPGRDLKELKFPWESGDKRIEKEKASAVKENRQPRDNAFFAGTLALTARSKYRPQLAALQNGRVVEYNDDNIALAKSVLYNGIYVLAQVNFTAYEGQQEDGIGNPDGVNAYLDMVMKVKDGERIGGSSPASVFKSYVGQMTDEDPTTGMPGDGDDLSDLGV